MKTVPHPSELLHGIEKKDDFKKELLLNNKLYSIRYRSGKEDENVFSLYFSDENDFLEQKENITKGNASQVAITFPDCNYSGHELELSDKVGIQCTIIDIRSDFLKIKLTS